jgi:hypothetical protein
MAMIKPRVPTTMWRSARSSVMSLPGQVTFSHLVLGLCPAGAVRAGAVPHACCQLISATSAGRRSLWRVRSRPGTPIPRLKNQFNVCSWDEDAYSYQLAS